VTSGPITPRIIPKTPSALIFNADNDVKKINKLVQKSKQNSASKIKEADSEIKPPKSPPIKKDGRNSNLSQTASSLKEQIINQNLFSDTYMSYAGKKVNIPMFDEEFYISFMEKLIFSKKVEVRKTIIMNPIPPQVNQLFFIVKRNTSLIGKNSGAFDLFLEKGGGERILVIRAIKKKFTVNNYYLI
jgi:hypothetical protein